MESYFVYAILVISPEMTCKTGQISVRLCGVNNFKTLSLRDCWVDVDGTHVHLIRRGIKHLGSRILNFGLFTALGDPELSPVGRDDPPTPTGVLIISHSVVLSSTVIHLREIHPPLRAEKKLNVQ